MSLNSLNNQPILDTSASQGKMSMHINITLRACGLISRNNNLDQHLEILGRFSHQTEEMVSRETAQEAAGGNQARLILLVQAAHLRLLNRILHQIGGMAALQVATLHNKDLSLLGTAHHKGPRHPPNHKVHLQDC